MELVYLWVEKYKNIENQGFNFSARFRCDYNPETNELKIEENQNFKENIFGKNINITAIVGRNGSGKSAILEAIINDIIFNQKIDYKPQSLYCYFNDEKNEIYINSSLITEENEIKSNFPYKFTHIESENEVSGYKSSSFMNKKKQLKRFKEEYSKSFFYFYNNNFEIDNHNRTDVYKYNEELLFYQEVDKSNNTINLEKEESKIYTYLLELFLSKDRLPSEIENLYIPTKIFLDRNIFEYFSEEVYKIEEEDYRNIISDASPDNVENILKLETLIYLRNYIRNKTFHDAWNDKIEVLKEILLTENIVKNYSSIIEDIIYYDRVNGLSNKINFTKRDIRHDDNKSNDTYLENINELEKILYVLNNSSLIANLIKYVHNDPDYDYEIDIINLNSENIEELKNLPSYLRVDFANKRAVKFSELSSGEQNILKLLFSIENIIHKREGKTKSFFILLDEIENTLHPNWQKKIINWIVKFLKNYKDLQFNLIMTSHSPFILSDIPKEDIIFLDTYDNKSIGKYKSLNLEHLKAGNCINVSNKVDIKPFGANIHKLLSHGFFMEDGLIGEFAKSKINEIINFHKIVSKNRHKKYLASIYLKSRKEKFWQTQSIIGEDYLKQIVKNHLIEIEKILLGKDKAKEEEIKRVKEYLKSLEND